MDVVLRDLTGTECWVFIDDLILFSDTIEEHACRLEHVLQRLDRANLQLQPAKCVFAQAQVQYLGYVVSRDGITASPDKLEAVRRYPVPKKRQRYQSLFRVSIVLQTSCTQIRGDSQTAKK